MVRRAHQNRNCWEKYLSRFPVGLGDPLEPAPPQGECVMEDPVLPIWLVEQFPGWAFPEKLTQP